MIAPFSVQVEGLDTIPGVDRRTAEVIMAEIGVDMTQFPSAGHLSSWAGVCPGNNESAGKRKTGKTRPGPKWLRKGLTEAAKAAARSKGTYLAAQHARIKRRRGPAKATGANRHRHSILIAAYYILRDEVTYHELGADYFVNRGDTDAHVTDWSVSSSTSERRSRSNPSR